MNRYLVLAKPPRADAGDDHYRDGSRSMDVLVSDDRPVDTGLVNAAGERLFRVPQRVQIGYRGKDA